MPEDPELAQPLALLLLAAGRASRFGSNKLAVPVAGRPLCHHAALAFAGHAFARRIAVVGEGDLGLTELGFECFRAAPDAAALSASIATGMRAIAEGPNPAGVLIALGDMPLVTSSLVDQLVEAFDGEAVASAVNGRPQPPALFGRRYFPALLALEGDAGARDLLRNARKVEADPATLADIDTPADLARVRALLEQAKA